MQHRTIFSLVLGLSMAAGAFAVAAPGAAEHLAEKAKTAFEPQDRFACTEVIGVSVTGDWFGAGFEKGVDDKRWQGRTKTHAFVELWGDPSNEVWKTPVVSPCAEHGSNPDRVIFTAVNWEWKTADLWTAGITKAVETIKAKYPGVKRIEVITMLRAPGNKTCGDYRTVVEPYVDEAVARVSTAFPSLVRPGPKFEPPTCEVFTKGGPHFTKPGMEVVAKVYADHYGQKNKTKS